MLNSSKDLLNIKDVRESTLGGGGKIVVTLYYFLRVPCLNFNHVIIMKQIHNVFAYYGRSNPQIKV